MNEWNDGMRETLRQLSSDYRDDGEGSVLGLAVAAYREVERLKAIVSRLPVTADGATITPGMTLWYRSSEGIIPTPTIADWQDVLGYTEEDEMAGPNEFFSTRKAAEAGGAT